MTQLVIHDAAGVIASVMRASSFPDPLPLSLIPSGYSSLFVSDEIVISPGSHTIEGGEIIEQLPDLTGPKTEKWEATKIYRDNVVDGGCMTPHGPLQSDSESRLKINGAVQMAILAQMTSTPFTIVWTMADNSMVELNAEDTIALGLVVANHVGAAFGVGIALRAAINAAASIEDLEAINIPHAGWPPTV